MKNILSSLNESEKKRILEMHNNASKRHYLNEQNTTNEPGDPTQSTVDLSTDYTNLRSALMTYNSTVKSIMGVDPGLFLRSSNKLPSQLLITSGGRQDDSGQGTSGDNFVLRYDIPTGVLKRRVGSNPVKFYTLPLDGNTIGTGPGGIWYFGLSEDLKKKEKKVDQVKAAANVAGAAIASFFSKVQGSVPKNYVVNKTKSYADGTDEYIFGPPTP